MAEYRTDQYRTAFRATLHPDYEGISDEQADALFESVTAGMSPPEADAYMEGLGSWLKQAGNTLASTAPIWAPIAGAAVGSIVPGVGTAIGGAVGGLAGNVAGRLAANPRANAGSVVAAGLQGAVAGGAGGRSATTAGLASAAVGLVGSALQGGAGAAPAARRQPAPPASRPLAPEPTPAAAPALVAVPAPAATPSRPAATQLMTLLNNPHLSRAVLGQANGAVGRSTVPVRAGGRSHQIPFGAFLNALVQLAQLAAIEATDAGGSSGSYLTDSEGSYTYDPAAPEQRAEALLALLAAEYEENAALPDEQEADYAEAGPDYDPLTEWFLSSGLIR